MRRGSCRFYTRQSHYREFYDVPRLIAVDYGGELFVFDALFDDHVDDYADEFTVRRLPKSARPLVTDSSWLPLVGLGEFVGTVAVQDVEFDSTRRSAIHSRVFETLRLA